MREGTRESTKGKEEGGRDVGGTSNKLTTVSRRKTRRKTLSPAETVDPQHLLPLILLWSPFLVLVSCHLSSSLFFLSVSFLRINKFLVPFGCNS
jgi:hypothetical protein